MVEPASKRHGDAMRHLLSRSRLLLGALLALSLAAGAGIVGLSSLSDAQRLAQSVYGDRILSIDGLADARAELGYLDGYLLRAIVAKDPDQRATWTKLANASMVRITRMVERVKLVAKGRGETLALSAFETDWAAYQAAAQETLAAAGEERADAAATYLAGAGSLYFSVDGDLSRLVDVHAASARLQLKTLETAFGSGRLIVIGVLVAGLVLALAIVGLVLARERARERLREADARYRLLVESANVIAWEMELPSARFTYVSPQAERLLGYGVAEWRELDSWAERLHPDDRQLVMERTEEQVREDHDGELEYRMIAADGRSVWFRDLVTLVHRNGSVVGRRGVMLDITERKRLEGELSHQAFHDALTGLPNRALFLQRLQHAVQRGARSTQSIGVLFLDLDDFKYVNDALGHRAGDQLLAEVATRLLTATRMGDTAARLGGDEFTLLLEEIPDVTVALQIAERIEKALAAPIAIDGREVRVAASIGIACMPAATADPEDLVAQADAAMYAAKERGKGTIELFDPSMRDRAWSRLELENELRAALEAGSITVHYQPVIDLATGEISDVEALARWEHPQRGLLAPAHFIPVAEQSGLIVPLGLAVLRQACSQLSAWLVELGDRAPQGVSVNLSARQFRDPGLVDAVAETLAAAGLDPSRLTLEITETVMISDTATAAEALRALRALGVRLVIDDFGTGFSALTYFKRFDLDGMKIDRSFVAAMTGHKQDRAIVEAAIAFARATGLTVTAEGVEDDDQLALLRGLGCDRAQGYLFARPASGVTTGEFLAAASAARATGPAPAPARRSRKAPATSPTAGLA
jgi:diguanylate cyclase (GGDEF)-like protein/PAS domain S-box-containing protein